MATKGAVVLAFLTNNKGTKLVSLVLALVAWYSIQTVISHESVLGDIPLTIKLDDGWAVLDRSADTVDVLFRGSQEDIRYLTRDQVQVSIDLRGHAHSGELVVGLGPGNVRSPGAVRPVQIRPEAVTLKLDPDAEVKVPVKADLQGLPPEGFEVESIVCTPDSVLLTGPRQRVSEVDALRTVPIDLEGRSRSFKKLKLGVMPPSETWVSLISPSNVAVEVSIVERASTREFENVPVTVLLRPGRRPKLEIVPDRVNLVLRGHAEALKDLTMEQVQAYVAVTELDAGTEYELPVQVHAPLGVNAVETVPAKVKVTQVE